MRFSMPHFPGEFEIPDDWIAEAGFNGFKPNDPAYRSTTRGVLLVPLTQIEPVARFVAYPGVELPDHQHGTARTFELARAAAALR
jgi:hypothetical protein